MTEALIKYQILPRMHLNFKRNIPRQWSELSPQQLLAITAQWENRDNDKLADNRFIHQVLGIPWFFAKRLHPFEVFELISYMQFLWNTQPHDSFIISELAGGIAPNPGLEALPFAQFIYIDTWFDAYNKQKPTDNKHQPSPQCLQALHKFLSAVYRKKGSPFIEKNVKDRAHLFQNIDPATQQAVVTNYMLIREWLFNRYKYLFPRKKKQEEEKKPDLNRAQKFKLGPQTPDEQGWPHIFELLVGDDIINNDKYAKMPTHRVLSFLNRKIKDKQHGKV